MIVTEDNGDTYLAEDGLPVCTIPYEIKEASTMYYTPKHLRLLVRGEDIRAARLEAGIQLQKDLCWLCEKETGEMWYMQRMSEYEQPGVKSLRADRVFAMCRVICRAYKVKAGR